MISPINGLSFRGDYTPKQNKEIKKNDYINAANNKEQQECKEDYVDSLNKLGCFAGVLTTCLMFGAVLFGGVKQCNESSEKGFKEAAKIAGSDSLKQLTKDTVDIIGKIK